MNTMMWRFTEGNAQPEEIDMIWELSKQVNSKLIISWKSLTKLPNPDKITQTWQNYPILTKLPNPDKTNQSWQNHQTSRLRATPSALWLTELPGQSRVLSGTSDQSWKTGKFSPRKVWFAELFKIQVNLPGLRNIMQELLRQRLLPTEKNLILWKPVNTLQLNPNAPFQSPMMMWMSLNSG